MQQQSSDLKVLQRMTLNLLKVLAFETLILVLLVTHQQETATWESFE